MIKSSHLPPPSSQPEPGIGRVFPKATDIDDVRLHGEILLDEILYKLVIIDRELRWHSGNNDIF